MTTVEKQKILYNNIVLGLEKVYTKLIEFKKQKKTHLIILKNDKVVRIKP